MYLIKENVRYKKNSFLNSYTIKFNGKNGWEYHGEEYGDVSKIKTVLPDAQCPEAIAYVLQEFPKENNTLHSEFQKKYSRTI